MNSYFCKSCRTIGYNNLSIRCRACSFRMCHTCYDKGYVVIIHNNMVSILSINQPLDLNIIENDPNYNYSCDDIECVMLVNSMVNRYLSIQKRMGG